MNYEVKTNIYGQPATKANQSSLGLTNSQRFAKFTSSPGVSALFGSAEAAGAKFGMEQPTTMNALNTKQLGRYNDTFKSKVFDHADYEPLTSKQSAAGRSVREYGTSIEDFGRRVLPPEKPREKIMPIARPNYDTPEKDLPPSY